MTDDVVRGDSFVKVDCGILDSSLYYADRRDQRSMFLTSLWMARPFELTQPTPQIHVREIKPTGWIVPAGWYGLVRASAIGIMQRDGIDREKGVDAGYAALEALGAPDADSRSQDYDGRRLVRIDGGYLVLNYFAYRDRDYTAAERMRRMRSRKKATVDLFDGPGLPGIGTSAPEPTACEICGKSAAPLERDHDHTRQLERGMVCRQCNIDVRDVEAGRRSATPEIERYVTSYVTARNAVRNVTHGIEQKAEAEAKPGTTGALVPFGNGQAKPLPAIRGKRDVVTIKERLSIVIAEIHEGSRQGFERDQIRTLQAEMVFAYWQAKYRKPRAQLDSRREALIKKRLVENGGDVSELFYALDGAMKDDWVMGRSANAEGTHDEIEHILRNRANIERYANKCRDYRDSKEHPLTLKYAQIFADPSGDAKQIEGQT